MAAVFAPLDEIERDRRRRSTATWSSPTSTAPARRSIGGASDAVDQAVGRVRRGRLSPRCRSRSATPSTRRSSRRPASRCGRRSTRLELRPPALPIVANVSGEFYPTGPGVRGADARHPRPPGRLAGPVRAGPAHAVRRRRPRVRRGRPEEGAARLRRGRARRRARDVARAVHQPPEAWATSCVQPGAVRALRGGPRRRSRGRRAAPRRVSAIAPVARNETDRSHAWTIGIASSAGCSPTSSTTAARSWRRSRRRARAAARRRPSRPSEPVVITGAALGLPGTARVFDDDNLGRILRRRAAHRRHPARASATRSSTSTSPGWSRATTASGASRRSTAPTM